MKDEDKSKAELISELKELRQRLAIRWAPGIGEGESAEDLPPAVELLRATLESTADGILVVDSQGRLVAFNEHFKRMWKIPEPIATSRNDEKTLAVVADQLKDPEAFSDKVQELYSQPDAESFDTLEFKDGRHFERYSRPLVISGTNQGRVWSFRDITERVRIEHKLRESTQRLALVMDAIPAFISYIDSNQRYVVVNQQYERTFGVQRRDIIGKSVIDLFAEPTYSKILPYIKGVLRGERQHYESPMELPNLGKRTLRVDYVPDSDAEGMVRGYYALATDVTERIQVEEELERYRGDLEDMVSQRTLQFESARDEAQKANEAKREFLARMSHEIRTPLNGVIGLSRLLLKGDLPPQEHEYAEMLRASANVLLQLVEGILDFSKIEAGKVSISTTDFHISDLLRNVRNLLNPVAEERGLDLRIEADQDHDRFHGDRDRIRQVLFNLVGNAIKFTPAGHISISSESRGRAPEDDSQHLIRFTVRDTGIGIPESARTRIFERFERVEQPGSTSAEGAGLGLAISKKLVELMGGEIGVLPGDGPGSAFWFDIPLAREAPQVTSDTAHPEPMAAAMSNGRQILVVEDNPVNQLVTQRALEDLGCHVSVTADGLEAIEALSRADFDLVLMDCRMPRLDGYETTRRIREQEVRGERLPIIALTAQAMREDLEECLEAGMDDYLSKPFREADLQAVLSRWLS